MPAASRPSRSLLALAVVATLFAASVPLNAGAAERNAPAQIAAGAVAAGAQHAPAALGAAAGDPTTTGTRGRASLVEPRPVGVAKAAKSGTAGSGTTSAASYKGRNHVWIPALGISRSVSFYSCSSSYYPGNRVYRWGCAGSNNVYLFGHAHSVFRALHDAYVRGRLYKGLKVYYANGAGKVATYAVSWWKLTTADKGAWAYAGQSTPSLTLQTCVGSQSQ